MPTRNSYLALQAAYDEFQNREQATKSAVRTYVPKFLKLRHDRYRHGPSKPKPAPYCRPFCAG